MANALKEKSTVILIFIAPNDEATEVLRIFFENHYEFMREKSYENGPLKLVQYYISESPEWEGEDNRAPVPFFDGKFPNKTGRTVFVLNEIYENEDGLHHHFMEFKDVMPEFNEMLSTFKIEFQCLNQMKIIQSLWD